MCWGCRHKKWTTIEGIFTNSTWAISDSYWVGNYLHSSVGILAHSTTLDCLLDPSLNIIWMASLLGFPLLDKISIFPCLSICGYPVLIFCFQWQLFFYQIRYSQWSVQQQVSGLIEILLCKTLCIKCDSIVAPNNSNLGIVWVLTGTTQAFDAIIQTFTLALS